MRRISLYINKENVKRALYELGKLKLIQFVDLNAHLKNEQLPYNKEILHYEKLRSKINFLMGEIEAYDMEVHRNEHVFDEDAIERHFNRLLELKSIRDGAQEQLTNLSENLFILEEMKEHDFSSSSCLTGIIDNDKVLLLRRILESVLKNNLVIHMKTGRRTVFVIFTHGEEAFEKIKKICVSFNARIFMMKSEEEQSEKQPKNEDNEKKDEEQKEENKDNNKGEEHEDENQTNILRVTALIQQYQHVHANNENSIKNELGTIAQHIHTWKYKTRQVLRILKTLNRLRESTAFIGEGYVPESKFPVFQNAVNTICDAHGRIAYEEQVRTGGNLEVSVLVTGNNKKRRQKRMNEREIRRLMKGEGSNGENRENKIEDERYLEVDGTGSSGRARERSAPDIESDGERSSDAQLDGMSEEKGGVACTTDRSAEQREKARDVNQADDAESDASNSSGEKTHKNGDKTRPSGGNVQHRTDQYEQTRNKRRSTKIDSDLPHKTENSSLSNSMEDIHAARAQNEDHKVQENEMPPTFFRTNIFTRPFQEMNDVYGVPSYREINPAPFTIITFPFLFGAMFGDVGHGLILVLIAVLFIRRPELARVHEMVEMVVNGRYMLLACGVMSMYFGLLYSEFFGVVMPLFKFGGVTYFGVDPSWHEAKNGMNLMNSLKMKMSVVIGTVHMGLGLCLAAFNTVLTRDKLLFYCKVLPRILSFACFAGYLSVLIVVKWIRPFKPSIINTIVLMFTDPFKAEFFYPGQLYVQLFMLALFAVCMPWMMVSYPIMLFIKHKRKNLSDVIIHFGIEAIEFNIGLISNISSYLRIWAVSLAHSQLTGIIHKYTMGSANVIVRIVSAPVWLLATMVLMVALEGLSSSLHAMRLNWIEFNSKFYDGQGNPFQPLNFDEDSDV
ncbi:hypothetical protein VCUG_00639 [Vavraia culicis subsp. floridensis]|uniref:V-type proton ATPase subunit a n=1 Tax=Vavraia culicis (isolate floridensis) TaxID=948595 RepID=L2GWC2_VAVCU|nr:uncharacterized protein VCUG_00639 [Vavraia culicis subsp. floridensis]ELA47919.1 hypothetical protein VCUG_00639 [Vavraia culicis subsp. floridensis]